LNEIKKPQANEIVINGSAIGAGLVALGSEDLNLYEELKNILFTN
jgi:hypothetical protein